MPKSKLQTMIPYCFFLKHQYNLSLLCSETFSGSPPPVAVQSPSWSLTECLGSLEPSGKLINLPVSPFPDLLAKGDQNSNHPMGLPWGLNKVAQVKHLAQFPAQSDSDPC